MSKQEVLRNKILLLLIALTSGIGNIVVPNLSTIAKAYPDVPDSVLLMITTLPFLTSIPTSLFCVVFCRMLGNKKTVLLSMILLGIGGAFPVLFRNFTLVLVGRAILGLGWGIVLTIPLSLVSEYIPANEQATFIGIATAVISLGSAIFTFLAGFLGANIMIMWGSHLVAFLFFAIFLFVFPKDKKAVVKVPSNETQDAPAEKHKTKLPNAFFVILALDLLLTGCIMCGQNNVSFFVESKGFGTSQIAGTILSVYSVMNFAGGLVTGAAVKLFKKHTMLVCTIITAASYAIFALAPNMPILWTGTIVMGFTLGVINAMVYVHNSWIVPAEDTDVATSILSGLNLAACFFMVYVPIYLAQILGYGDSYTAQYIIIAVLFVIIGIMHLVVFSQKTVKKSIDQFFAEADGQSQSLSTFK